MNDAQLFLKALRAVDGLPAAAHLTLTAMQPDRRRCAPSRHIPLADTRALQDTLADLLAANRQGWDAFVGLAARQPGLTRWQRGGLRNLTALTALYVDIDRPPLEALPALQAIHLPPSCVISSGRGLHAYWWLSPASSDLPTAGRILRDLARRTGGDILTPAQSMRLPGSINWRRSAPCRILSLCNRQYTLPDFAAYLPAAPAPRPTRHPGSGLLNSGLIQHIVSILIAEYDGYRKANGWLAARCPGQHRHDRPGAHFFFNPRLGMGHCFGRHGRLLLRDLCPLLGLRGQFYLRG